MEALFLDLLFLLIPKTQIVIASRLLTDLEVARRDERH